MSARLVTKTGERKKARFKRKSPVKVGSIALYTSAFVAITTLVAVGYSAPKGGTAPAASVTSLAGNEQTPALTSVNEVVATAIAASVAQTVNLPVADNVANLSVSLAAKDDMAASSSTSITKQEIVQPTADGRNFDSYTAVAGDTVDSIAAHYGVSKDTIKWANNLTSDALDAGKQLTIPPVDGVVYTVKSGDTVDALAQKYGADAARIVAYNDLELGGLSQDSKIIIPGGIPPETERPGYVAPRAVQSYSASYTTSSFTAGSVGNRYAYGYCTWYAYERRASMGRPVGSFWGNASTWAAAARTQGFTVSNVPVAGAVFQTSYGGGGYGHVGIIESVDAASGTVTYSDMNGLAGWGRVGTSTTSIADAQARWVFIY